MGEIVTTKISDLEDIIQKEIYKVLFLVSEKYKLNLEKLNDSVFHDNKDNKSNKYILNLKKDYPSLISTTPIKEKKLRPIDPSKYCLARKPNLKQCTRNKKNNCDFCASHQYSQPYGRIDQEIVTNKNTNSHSNLNTNTVEKKKKIKKTTIKMKPKMIGDREYFIDNNNHLYIQEKDQGITKYRHIGNWNEHNNTIILKNILN
jgi:hypothetical protein